MPLRFTPKSENEIASQNLIPPGEYEFTVIGATDTVSKAGEPMIKLVLSLWMPNGQQMKQNDYLLAIESMDFKLRHFCEAAGILDQYDKGVLAAEHCQNRSGKLKLGIQKSKDPKYSDQNSVKDYIPMESKANLGPSADPDDPFA